MNIRVVGRRNLPSLCGGLVFALSFWAGLVAELPRGPRMAPADVDERGPAATDALGGFLWRRHGWLSDDGTIRPGGLERALRQRAANLAASRRRAPGGIDRALWTNRGPQNVGGRVRSLLVDPTDPSRLVAGSVSGGIFRSTDGGATWKPVDDFLPNLAIGSMAMDPRAPRTMYAGTGEGFFPSDGVSGIGIFKSTDGGTTWKLLPATANGRGAINRIALTHDGKVLLAGGSMNQQSGIFRSTDGGTTWTQVFDQYVFDIETHPTDPQQALATYSAWWPAQNDTYHHVLYTADGGRTWKTATGLDSKTWLGRIEVAYAPSDPRIVYAASQETIYKSTDGGRSFTTVRKLDGSGLSWYCDAVWVAPNDPNVIVVGGGGLHRSTDGGVTFESIGNGYLLTEDPHPDHHRIVAAPGYDGVANRRVYDTSDGGVFRTDDILAVGQNGGWVSLVRGLQTTQFYAVVGDGARDVLLGGTQDNGTLRLDRGSTDGSLVYGGDGGQSAIDWQDPRYCYGEYVGLRPFRSDNGCQSWTGDLTSLPDYGLGNWIAPLLLDPADPRRLYAGGRSLWRTDDARAASPVWREVRPRGTDNVLAIAVAPSDPNTVWITQNDSKVYRTSNALAPTPTWTTVDDNAGTNPLPSRWMPHVLIDRQNPSRVWIGLGGFEDHNLWRTDDGGATWKDVSGSGATGLPFVGVRALAQHPRHPDWLYAATDVGIFSTADGGRTWSTGTAGPANVSTDDVAFAHDSSTLIAGTHGRGLWTADTDAFSAGVPCVANASTLCLAGGRFRVFATWSTGADSGLAHAAALTADTGTFWFFDPNNVEMVVKVLDACAVNRRFWTFAGGLTNVGVTLYVVDSVTGQTRTYQNPQGHPYQPVQDTDAFVGCGAGSEPAKAMVGATSSRERVAESLAACGGVPGDLCLGGGRYRVSAAWTANGQQGQGTGVAITPDTGYFWFFGASNVELLVKALDACGVNGRHWVFAGGLTNVAVVLRVTDTWTGVVKEYDNPAATPFQPIQDTQAFECP